MNAIVFDASTIITLAMTNMLWILKPLKKQLKGELYIPLSVKKEVIDRPLHSNKFKLEALQVLALVSDGTLKIFDQKKIHAKEAYLLELVNNMFQARGRYLTVAHAGEIGALAVAVVSEVDFVAVDERTTRSLIENPERIKENLSRKLHTEVKINQQNLKLWKKEMKNMFALRSAELGMIAYEIGLFDKYLDPRGQQHIDLPLKKSLLDGFLWAVKLSGCSLTTTEINEFLALERIN